ncbi:Ser/Thr protein kinase RdoA (MazF antagonist) [Balneicella halophila]|uniref:Ser/Thr protein kinase RdoA (MazF antagonist) n=1 Tax=Balneicella halophila TaxID=1537566 RepID=A0A7L4UNM3_BALHA|nr:aminoglycoside phosphotransferase family protein [Balneicella halophila]PVX50783.1 Ser/Thr protein kinase RdoA (MazF antagonist) [Balneicella halophila]
MKNTFENILKEFFANPLVSSVSEYGNGHINDSYKIYFENGDCYLMQRINHKVFTNVEGMMDNIQKATAHIASKGKPTLNFLKTLKGKYFTKTADGTYWRLMHFEKGTKSYETTLSHEIAEATGRAIADFQIDLSDLDPKDFIEVIPEFHNLDARIVQLEEAIGDNKAKRLHTVENLVAYSKSLQHDFLRFYDEDDIPIRITHNDTKLNNILFTEDDSPYCLVDLDTVMPGYIHYDFGDVVRTMCNTAVDDEKDLDKVQFNYKLYQSYKKGYLSIAKQFLTEKEIKWLDVSGKLMTYIMAIRFLADYLNGDEYYKINYPMHNYDRAHCQFKLLKEMYQYI